MEREKIEEKLATECMGWKCRMTSTKDAPGLWGYGYIDKTKKFMCWHCDWHPLSDWNQLMMCVKQVCRINKQQLELCITISADGLEWLVIIMALDNPCALPMAQADKARLTAAEAIGKAQGWWEE